MTPEVSPHTCFSIGLISDTHGRLSPRVATLFKGVAAIVHAGDIDSFAVLWSLRTIAPVTAVRGNVDRFPGAWDLPLAETVQIGRLRIHVRHDLGGLDLDPAAAGCDVVVTGHTHHPADERRDGVLYVNPGSAGAPRGGFPPMVALLDVTPETVKTRFEVLS